MPSAVSLAAIIGPTAVVAPSVHCALRPAADALAPARLRLAVALRCTVVVCSAAWLRRIGHTITTVCGTVGILVVVVVVGCSGRRRLLRDKHSGVRVQLCRAAARSAIGRSLVGVVQKHTLDEIWGILTSQAE